MTGKDVIKLLMISIGFDRNLSIETNKTADNATHYDVSGQNEKGEWFSFDGFSIIDVIAEFLKEFRSEFYKEGNPYQVYDFCNTAMLDYSIKDVLNDDFRNSVYQNRREQDEAVKKYVEETRYITEWCKANHPCPNCPDNKKNHWDSIHYNCEKNYTMSCPKLREFHTKSYQMYREYAEKKKNQ